MPYAFFQISAHASPETAAPLNVFLRTQRIVRVTRQWCEAGTESAWAFCIEYAEKASDIQNMATTTKVDYKEVLSPEDFEVFARLRTLRKQLSEEDGVPLFALFTNAQLAEISKRRMQTLAELKKISGIGDAKIAKYGEKVLAVVKEGGVTE